MQIDGKPVIDTRKKIVLTITPRDVANGKKKAADCCAAAKACVRQFGAKSARVYTSRVYIEMPEHWLRFHTPESLRTEIVSFDRGHAFEPGEYPLTPMQKSKATGKRQGSNTPKRRAKRRAPYHIVKGIRARASGWETAAG